MEYPYTGSQVAWESGVRLGGGAEWRDTQALPTLMHGLETSVMKSSEMMDVDL